MRIRRLHLAGFGKLRGEMTFAPDRCNLILAPNESGKSTLVAALITALYGHPAERRSKNLPIPTRDVFRPWDGGPYALTVEFTLGSESYTLHRDLAGERVELLEGKTGKDIAGKFRGEGGRHEILEQMIGLEREDFERSALVMQEEVQKIREGEDITLRLQKFATSHGGDITAGEAVECLEDALTRYPGTQLAGRGRVETEIDRLEERLAEVRGSERQLDDELEAARDDLVLLDELGGRERELADELHRLDYLRTRAILSEIEAQIAEQERAVERLGELEAEAESLAGYREFPLDLEGEINELKGKVDELAGHIMTSRDRHHEEVESPLADLRRSVQGIDPDLLADSELARVEAAALRLRDARSQLKEAKAQVRDERRRLRREGVDLEEASGLAERFRPLSPEDRTFLEDYRERVLELEARGSDWIVEDEPADAGPAGTAPGGSRRWALGVPGVLLLAAAAVAWPMFSDTTTGMAMSAVAGAAGLALLAGAALASRRRPAPAPSRETAEDALRSLRDRADVVCRALGFADRDAMLAPFRRLTEIRRGTAELQERMVRLADRDEEHGRAREAAAEILGRAGQRPSVDRVRPRDVEALRDRMREGLRHRERADELGKRSERSAGELRGMEERLEGMRGRMVEILERAGLPVPEESGELSEDSVEILRRFSEAAEQARRLRHLAEESIPEASASVAAEEWLTKRRTELRTMEEVLQEIVRRGPFDPAPDPTHSSNHYVVEFKRMDDELRGVQTRRREVFGRVGDLLRRHREEGPALAEERERLEGALSRADGFSRAVRLAADLLTEISRESYEQWATALNDRSNRALGHLNPAYRDLRFDTDLSFTLEEVATGRRLNRDEVDVHLSAGARDQIYLAIRLAVSDYFSAGKVRLPLVLDDVLASTDDERFDRVMEYLADRISPRHQVILLSCQEERHRRWRERHPDLFDGRMRPLLLPSLEKDAVQ